MLTPQAAPTRRLLDCQTTLHRQLISGFPLFDCPSEYSSSGKALPRRTLFMTLMIGQRFQWSIDSCSPIRSSVLCFHGFRRLPFGSDVVCRDRETITVDDLKDSLPSPRWGVRSGIVCSRHNESILRSLAF